MGLAFKSKLTGDFLERIRLRSEKFASIQHIAATIVVPDDMIWWYYNEYGTATKSLVNPGIAYDIVPVNANSLAFPGADGGTVFAHAVLHPGIKPSKMVEMVREEIRVYVAKAVKEYFTEFDFDPTLVKESLLSTIMPRVKEFITQSFAQQLTGVRVDGKLGGRSAAEVFDQEATVVDTSS